MYVHGVGWVNQDVASKTLTEMEIEFALLFCSRNFSLEYTGALLPQAGDSMFLGPSKAASHEFA